MNNAAPVQGPLFFDFVDPSFQNSKPLTLRARAENKTAE
jgi:hypothetical protein